MSNKIAIMQPYLFPYIGYFHLILASDIFVLYDDVNYIKKGYINRNNILFNGKVQRINLAVPGASQNILINKLSYSEDTNKLLQTLKYAYGKSEHFNKVFPIIEDIINYDNRSIPKLCNYSLNKLFEYLQIEKKIILSSDLNYDRGASASKKLVSICKTLDANVYINSPGGRSLYTRQMFEEYNIELKFIESEFLEYKQYMVTEFTPYLSIIDVLMNSDILSVKKILNHYSLKN